MLLSLFVYKMLTHVNDMNIKVLSIKICIFVCSVSDNYETQCSVDKSGRCWTCSSGQSNLICSVDKKKKRKRKISCRDEQHCPFTEESQHIDITVYVWRKYFYLDNYSKRFLLSEIGMCGDVFLFSCSGPLSLFLFVF